MLVIHPRKEIDYFKGLYSGNNYRYKFFDKKISKSKLNTEITKEKEIIFIVGFGTRFGLSSTEWLKNSLVSVVDENTVDALRSHLPIKKYTEEGDGRVIIGAWSDSVSFAKRYKLHGIFLGMNFVTCSYIAEDYFGINVRDETIDDINLGFSNRLSDCIKQALKRKINFSDIPDKMKEYITVDANTYGYNAYPLVEMLYGNVYYL